MAESARSTTINIEAPVRISPMYQFGKRVLDILLAVLALVPVGLLILLVVGVLIWLDSEGPIVIRQTRIGEHGRKFTMFKFRSMSPPANESRHRQAIARYMSGERISTGPATSAPFKLSNDPRVTHIGKLIRKTSLDELPQIINVLLGQMSLVGPRLPLPYEVERYNAWVRTRLAGMAGITGPWQIFGRRRVPFKEMVEMDIAYLRRQSLAYDVKLILATVPAVLSGDGAA
jgi:lipopolysaccharide/colanic/teichoic acid biosynthesis glycosyltransferase